MMTLSEAANVVGGILAGNDAVFASVSSDTRSLQAGALFVAIRGENFDGHDFVSRSGENGAVGALVSRRHGTGVPHIRVADTTLSLGRLAADWRSRFGIPVIAVTGSNGKTTVTSMVASILNHGGNCLFPEKSFNNQWGVPLTVLKLRDHHQFAVLELGMNQAKEIEYLAEMVKPNIALVNNVAPAHLEGLGSMENIARAKFAVYAGLAEQGIAVVNADDPFAKQWVARISSLPQGCSPVTFGVEHDAEVTLDNLETSALGSRFEIRQGDAVVGIDLPLPGRHNVSNALAAATVCMAAGAGHDAIQRGLESIQAVPGRLNLKRGSNGARILDDTYNANPRSLKAGIDVLTAFPGRKVLVLGRMAELGAESEQLHAEVGGYAREKGVDQLFCLATGQGKETQGYCEGFGRGATSFGSMEALVRRLGSIPGEDLTVLVKGSRSSRMERVVDRLVGPDNPARGEPRPC